MPKTRQTVKTVEIKAPCWYEGLSHMQLFGELIKRGPTMHGTPGNRKGEKSH